MYIKLLNTFAEFKIKVSDDKYFEIERDNFEENLFVQCRFRQN